MVWYDVDLYIILFLYRGSDRDSEIEYIMVKWKYIAENKIDNNVPQLHNVLVQYGMCASHVHFMYQSFSSLWWQQYI